jgi:uncharacterized membrane protein YgaE (UPF0421/DUF939 family)
MSNARAGFVARFKQQWLVHSIRTTIAAGVSLYVARLLRLPEAYWAPLTTIVVMQSTLGAALKPSWQRFIGTALGAVAGGLVASYVGSSAIVFIVGVFALGIICALLNLDRGAYRFASITLAIVVLVSRPTAAWMVALDRFIEVSIGIITGLLISAAWREPEPTAPRAAAPSSPRT